MPLAGRRNEGASSFLVESKLLLCTNTDEVNAGIRSPDILAGNRNTQDESVLVSLGLLRPTTLEVGSYGSGAGPCGV